MIDRVKTYAIVNNLMGGNKYYSRVDSDKWRRYHLMKFLKEREKLSLVGIAKVLNLKTHATVINGLAMYDDLKRYKDFRDTIEEVEILFPLDRQPPQLPELFVGNLVSLEQNLIR
jgi:hypothetical protein